ncbi:MAG: hypothetical protein MK086_09750 [Flavobacteriales bacterium]|nr:hypothetical protein [Flavobacteriales bacterium]
MKIFSFLFLFLLLVIPVQGQLLSQPQGRDFQPSAKFNANFIKANKIEKLTITEELKPDGERIKKTGRKLIYRFNLNGQVSSIQEITKSRDTLLTIYEYLDARLNCEIKNDAAGLFSYCYAYEDEKPVEVKYARLRKRTNPADRTEISTETFTHKSYESQLHSTQHNASGRPYKKEIRYFDENGYYLKYSSDFVMTSRHEEEKYTYNPHGHLSKKEVNRPYEEYTQHYEYDDVGNLTAEEMFKEGRKVERLEYVYREEDMLLQAELTRDELKQAIHIRSYTYSFRK